MGSPNLQVPGVLRRLNARNYDKIHFIHDPNIQYWSISNLLNTWTPFFMGLMKYDSRIKPLGAPYKKKTATMNPNTNARLLACLPAPFG